MEPSHPGKEAPLTHDEYLADYEHWTRDVASELARQNYIVDDELTPEHWKVIEYIRQYYGEYCRGPGVMKISKATGFSRKHICELFPCGTVRGAYRLAGLPRPPGCI
ncbi:MAG: TusE/DsrC/DsvC family sulfur relay protein [FCB group bacterium]|nr:TusE/DsrC/DsvC family sulfur relay protein [FCB group bacterium]